MRCFRPICSCWPICIKFNNPDHPTGGWLRVRSGPDLTTLSMFASSNVCVFFCGQCTLVRCSFAGAPFPGTCKDSNRLSLRWSTHAGWHFRLRNALFSSSVWVISVHLPADRKNYSCCCCEEVGCRVDWLNCLFIGAWLSNWFQSHPLH